MYSSGSGLARLRRARGRVQRQGLVAPRREAPPREGDRRERREQRPAERPEPRVRDARRERQRRARHGVDVDGQLRIKNRRREARRALDRRL